MQDLVDQAGDELLGRDAYGRRLTQVLQAATRSARRSVPSRESRYPVEPTRFETVIVTTRRGRVAERFSSPGTFSRRFGQRLTNGVCWTSHRRELLRRQAQAIPEGQQHRYAFRILHRSSSQASTCRSRCYERSEVHERVSTSSARPPLAKSSITAKRGVADPVQGGEQEARADPSRTIRRRIRRSCASR